MAKSDFELRGGSWFFFSFLLALPTFIPIVVFHFLFKLAGNWVRVWALPKIHHCYTLHVAVAFSDAEISERIDFTRVGGGLLILNYYKNL